MKSYRLKEAVQAYVSYVKGRGFSESTVRSASNLTSGTSPWSASKDVREIGEVDIATFRKALDAHTVRRSGKPLKRSSKYQILATLKTFFRFLEREGWILVSPMRDIKLKRVQSIPKALSVLKVEALITLQSPQTPIGQRNRALFEVLYGTGLRLSECERLDLSDIDLRQGTLLVRSGKGRKDRYVPVTGRARDTLQAYLMESRPLFAERRDGGALFLATGGRRLGAQSIRIMVRRAVAALVSGSALMCCGTRLRLISSKAERPSLTCRNSSVIKASEPPRSIRGSRPARSGRWSRNGIRESGRNPRSHSLAGEPPCHSNLTRSGTATS